MGTEIPVTRPAPGPAYDMKPGSAVANDGGAPRVDEGAELAFDLERFGNRLVELRWWVAGIIALSLIAGIVATLLMTPKYEATARIEINRIDTASSGIDGAGLGTETRDQQYYETQYELLRSRFLAERVVEEEGFENDPAFLEAFALPETGVEPRAAAGVLRGNVEIVPIEGSNLVDISITSNSRAMSADLANTWANTFLEANFDKRFGDTILAREQLESQLQELRARLEESEAELINYANANEIVVLQSGGGAEGGSPTQSTLVSQELGGLVTNLAEARARRIRAESVGQVGAPETAGGGLVGLRTSLASAQAELARVRANLGTEHPQVVALRQQIASLESSLNREQSLAGRSRRAELEAARAEEAQLQRRFDTAKQAFLGEQGRSVQYGILQREVDTNRELYDALLQRYKELGVAGSGSNNMTLVERAVPPGAPSAPSLPINLGIALLVGLLAAALLVYFRELLDQTIRDPVELRRSFDLPILGLIPKIDEDEIDDQLGDPHSVLSEAYAAVRSSLSFATEEGAPSPLMLTSTRPEEGKTLSSLAIAASVAKLDRKVLLIDMDLRRRGLSRLIGAQPGAGGMVGFLKGTTDSPSIVSLERYGIDFIPAGAAASNPSELVARPSLRGVLRDLAAQYDHVIIDGPPVLGIADAPELARAVDGVIFVVQANAAKRRAIGQALNRIRAGSSTLIGGIVTKLDRRNDTYGYGGRYGYGYGYAASENEDA